MPERVLVVDDDNRLATALAEGLRSRRPDLDVDVCVSAAAALEQLAQTDYDVVVTDVLMAGIDGLALVERIRALRPACVSVLITGRDERDLAVRALRAGAYDFLHKPIELDVFVASVARALEARHLRRDNEQQQAALAVHAAELEKTVEARTRALREANRIKDEFFATLSHELRTPLTAVLGWARLLRSEKLESEVRAKALDSIVRNSQSLATLIDDLLDVARIVQGKLRLSITRLDLASLLESAIENALPDAEAKAIRIEPSGLDSDGTSVSGDSERLRQVFSNLLANAIKFTPEQGRICVRLSRAAGSARVDVGDSGVGIRPEFLPHVFDRFRQDAAPAQEGGLGLGLTIVRQLVRAHGGTIEAHSDGEGLGATFTVWLPALDAASTSLADGLAAETATREPCLEGTSVLLVDDDADVRELMANVFRVAGAAVVTAATAAEARAAYGQRVPDVLILDLALPDEDGCVLLRSLRALAAATGGRVPAIALTASAGEAARLRALNAGFELHVPKPAPENLPSIVAGIIALHQRP